MALASGLLWAALLLPLAWPTLHGIAGVALAVWRSLGRTEGLGALWPDARVAGLLFHSFGLALLAGTVATAAATVCAAALLLPLPRWLRLALVAAAASGRARRQGMKMRLAANVNRALALLGASVPQMEARARAGASAMLVRAEVFRALGGFDERMGWSGHQRDLCWRVGRRGYRVALVEEPFTAGTRPQRLDRRLSFSLPSFRRDDARRRIAARVRRGNAARPALRAGAGRAIIRRNTPGEGSPAMASRLLGSVGIVTALVGAVALVPHWAATQQRASAPPLVITAFAFEAVTRISRKKEDG